MISIPLSQMLILCLFLSSVLGVCLFLFFSAKIDLRRIESKHAEHRLTTDRKLAEADLRFSLLETRVTDVSEKVQRLDDGNDPLSDSVLQNAAGASRKQRTAIMSVAMERQTAESEVRFNLLETKLSDLTEKLHVIDQALDQSRVSTVPVAPVAPVAPGATQGKRTAVIRMAQKGEAPDKIATSVGIPQNEVELLLKVHRAVTGR